MEYIGTIPYYTIEDGEEEEWEILDVFRDNYETSELFFSLKPLPRRIRESVSHFDTLMSKIVSELYGHFLPVFRNRKRFDSMIDDIVGSLTIFEDSDYFKKIHQLNAAGIHYDYQQEIFGRMIDSGSHIRFDARHPPGETIVHEYGHEMHFRSCDHKIAPFYYDNYDLVMEEVMGYAAERAMIGEERLSYKLPEIHTTAIGLLDGLKQIPEFTDKPFHKQWMILLQFPKHEMLKDYLIRLEKYLTEEKTDQKNP